MPIVAWTVIQAHCKTLFLDCKILKHFTNNVNLEDAGAFTTFKIAVDLIIHESQIAGEN